MLRILFVPHQVALPVWRLFAFLLCFLITASTYSAEISVELSTRKTSVGIPVTLVISITNAESIEPPELLRIENAEVLESAPTRSQSVEIIGGNSRVRRSMTYRYQIVPTSPGIIAIPEQVIRVDGVERSFGPFEIEARPSSPVMFVEVVAGRSSVYVGEALDLVLRIWVRPFREPRLNRTLEANAMWSLIDLQQSSWGIFDRALREMSQRDQQPIGTPTVRAVDGLSNETYYVYEIPRRIWPLRDSELDLGDIAVVIKYPLGLTEDFLRLALTGVRQVRVEAAPPTIEIKAIPTKGRPQEFRGAVGRFALTSSVQPLSTHVGDPMTITITVLDRSSSPADLSTLQPPPFEHDERFTTRFRIPKEPLTGIVEDRSKRFTQTLRPLNDSITEVPSIRFAYFDPTKEDFVVTESPPIEIEVAPARLSDDSALIPTTDEGENQRRSRLTTRSGGVRALVVDAERLLSTTSVFRPLAIGIAASLPPLLSVGYVLVVTMTRRADLRNRTTRRHQSSATRALKSMEAAERLSTVREQASSLASTLRGYIAENWELSNASLTSRDAVIALQKSFGRSELVERVDQLLRMCDSIQYSDAARPSITDMFREAETCISELDCIRSSITSAA